MTDTIVQNGHNDVLPDLTTMDVVIEASEADVLRAEAGRLRSEIDRLTEELALEQARYDRLLTEQRVDFRQRINEQYDRLTAHTNEALQRHEQDIALIGETLLEQARYRGWCEDYDDVISGLNGQLHVSLPERERSWTVNVNVRLDITVQATSDDEARDTAQQYVNGVETMIERNNANIVVHPEHPADYDVEAG